MYGDRRLVKDREIKTKGDQYLLEMLDEYVMRSGRQRHVVLREWIQAGLERDLNELVENKSSSI